MRGSLFISACASALVALPAAAQSPETGAQTPAASADTLALEEIVVTAQRRSERLQDVPVAVTAATGARLQAAGIQSTQDLSVVTPGLTVPQTNGYSQPRIRGVGTTSNGPGIENPVATYIDGVYIASAPSSLLTLNSVDRIEVLKGPQGTLFGRNATGGLIQIVTKDPSDTPSADVNLTYGDYWQVIADGYVTGRLAHNLSADLALRYEQQADGYGRNLFNGRPVGKIDHDFVGRFKVRFEPSDATKIGLSLDYSSRDSDQNIQHLVDQYPAPFDSAAFGGPFPRGGPYDVNNDTAFRNKLESGGASLHVDQNLGPVTAKSITAYRKSEFKFDLDLDYVPVDLVTAHSASEFEQFSQEFQLASQPGGRLAWVAGLYYFHANDGWLPLTISFEPPASPISGVPFANRVDTRQKTDSVAAYAQATYEIAPKTRLTLGGRFTYEEKRLAGSQTVLVAGTPPVVKPAPAPSLGIPDQIDFKRFNYRVALDHKFAPDFLGYVSFNTGFKSGGFVLASPTVAPYKPESISAAEIGFKSQFLERRARLNIAAFYYDYENIQVQRFDVGTIVIYNGAKAELYGLDMDGEFAVTRGLTLNGGFSYVHDRFKSFPDADFIVPVGGCAPAPGGFCSGSADGHKLPFTPTVNFNLGGDYKIETGVGDFTLNATYFWSSKFYAAPDNVLFQKSYDLLNASASWTAPDGHLTVRVWGKNLAGTVYATSLIEGATGGVRSLGQPRTYGVTTGLRF